MAKESEKSGLALGKNKGHRRVIELIRNGKEKRARKYSKKKLGTFGRAKDKVEELRRVIVESRRAGHYTQGYGRHLHGLIGRNTLRRKDDGPPLDGRGKTQPPPNSREALSV
ncbi:hypothetical protein C8A00DRAFT_28510 [Chaetomidium leptoderma]|uniref:Uncharacterized protein n=1 Tax=Chaetomidium leptoderma TaxID=669021 RepID=A0AAN6VW29_9PEZI|nr:hypothetical protein C8A00DRAFT_28510 [Chaetomidium leptoderma]